MPAFSGAWVIQECGTNQHTPASSLTAWNNFSARVMGSLGTGLAIGAGPRIGWDHVEVGRLKLTAGRAAGATSLAVSADHPAVAAGTFLRFMSSPTGAGVETTSTAYAAANATTISVSPLSGGLSSGARAGLYDDRVLDAAYEDIVGAPSYGPALTPGAGVGTTTFTVDVAGVGTRTVYAKYPATYTGTNAPIVSGVHPLIMVGHGSALDGASSTSTYSFLAGDGYIVVGPSFGNIVSNITQGATVTTAVIDHLLASNSTVLNGHVDGTRIGWAGRSMGGMIGYRLMHPTGGDPRIKAVHVVAGSALGSPSGNFSTGPALFHVHGVDDTIVSPSSGTSAYARAQVPKAFAWMSGGHDFSGLGTIGTNGARGFFKRYVCNLPGGLQQLQDAVSATNGASWYDYQLSEAAGGTGYKFAPRIMNGKYCPYNLLYDGSVHWGVGIARGVTLTQPASAGATSITVQPGYIDGTVQHPERPGHPAISSGTELVFEAIGSMTAPVRTFTTASVALTATTIPVQALPAAIEEGAEAPLYSGSGWYHEPFDTNGVTNPVVLLAYKQLALHMHDWVMSKGTGTIPICHFGSVPGMDYAELYYAGGGQGGEYMSILHGDGDATNQAYMVSANSDIMDACYDAAQGHYAVGFGISGLGNLAQVISPGMAQNCADHGAFNELMVVNANGWGPNGEWGSTVEATFDANVWPKQTIRGVQDIHAGNQYATTGGRTVAHWISMFTTHALYLPTRGADWCELYSDHIANLNGSVPNLQYHADLAAWNQMVASAKQFNAIVTDAPSVTQRAASINGTGFVTAAVEAERERTVTLDGVATIGVSADTGGLFERTVEMDAIATIGVGQQLEYNVAAAVGGKATITARSVPGAKARARPPLLLWP